jgi:hypothetical protein
LGWGDELLASGMARGAADRGVRIAFGDGKRIVWNTRADVIFRNNPNIARPGSERSPKIEWIAHYKGSRLYNRHVDNRWVWNYDFKAQPGEIYFDHEEIKARSRYGSGFVLIEPNVPLHKSVAVNKDWGFVKYQEIADRLKRDGYDVAQLAYGQKLLRGVRTMGTKDFRDALAIMSRASLVICPEGGLPHGAAAVGVPAVVIFGGFIPPGVTGYDMHTNLSYGEPACGSLYECSHCQRAMSMIKIDQVYQAALNRLRAA